MYSIRGLQIPGVPRTSDALTLLYKNNDITHCACGTVLVVADLEKHMLGEI